MTLSRPKLTKSWVVTFFAAFIVFAVPFANDLLTPYGIHVTEDEMNHILYAFFGVSAAGAGNAIHKRKTKSAAPQEPRATGGGSVEMPRPDGLQSGTPRPGGATDAPLTGGVDFDDDGYENDDTDQYQENNDNTDMPGEVKA